MDKNALGINAGLKIEGEVTEVKKELADQFHKTFESVNHEVEQIYSRPHDDKTLDFVKENITPEVLASIKKASPLSVFQFGKKFMIKTRDNKLEPVDSYCYRLERTILHQIAEKNKAVKALEGDLAQAVKTINDYRKRYETGSFFLKLKNSYAKLKSSIKNFLNLA